MQRMITSGLFVFCLLMLCAMTASAEEEQKPKFNVWEIRVENNTLLERKKVELAVYPYLGPAKTIDDIEAARANLESIYKANGYPTVLVDIPEQQVAGGIVYLRVTEGKIGRVRVKGNQYFSQRRILEKVPALQEGATPNMPNLQEQLMSLNSATGDRSITPIMKPGKKPGTLDVDLKVKDEFPVHVNTELNNRYTAGTEKLRFNGSVTYSNLWQKEHQATISLQTAPQNPDQVKVISGTYVLPSETDNHFWVFYLVGTDSDIAPLPDVNVLGKGFIGGARFIKPLQTFPGYTHNLITGFDYKDFSETINVVETGESQLTPITYASFNLGYSGTKQWEKISLGLNLSATFGVDHLVNDWLEFRNKRFTAEPNFFYVRGGLNYEQLVADDWVWSWAGEFQLSNSALISNEQYGAGGVGTVRGYPESTQFGDDAVFATTQIKTPSLADKIATALDDLHFIAFIDAAALRIRSPQGGQDKYGLLGAGLGLRLQAWDHWVSEILVAQPLRRIRDIEKGETLTHWRLNYSF